MGIETTFKNKRGLFRSLLQLLCSRQHAVHFPDKATCIGKNKQTKQNYKGNPGQGSTEALPQATISPQSSDGEVSFRSMD